jgi:hypothetical protein
MKIFKTYLNLCSHHSSAVHNALFEKVMTSHQRTSDWDCTKCGRTRLFAKRTVCNRCGAPRFSPMSPPITYDIKTQETADNETRRATDQKKWEAFTDSQRKLCLETIKRLIDGRTADHLTKHRSTEGYCTICFTGSTIHSCPHDAWKFDCSRRICGACYEKYHSCGPCLGSHETRFTASSNHYRFCEDNGIFASIGGTSDSPFCVIS